MKTHSHKFLRLVLFLTLTGFAGALIYPSFNWMDMNGWKRIELWATYYYTPILKNSRRGIAVKGPDGQPIGPKLNERDWRTALLEGTFAIAGEGKTNVYNYITRKESLRGPDYVVFSLSQGPYGDGVLDYKLVPYRSIAVDPEIIPLGTAIFIPAAVNQRIILPDGRTIRHDGYFFAADCGSAVKGHHIDVYMGNTTENPFEDWLTSSPDHEFEAFILPDGSIKRKLEIQHRAQ